MMGWYNDYGYVHGGLGMVLAMLLIWLPLIGLGIWLIARVTRADARPTSQAPTASQHQVDSARAILDRRFANGEIPAETYTEMRRILESGTGK